MMAQVICGHDSRIFQVNLLTGHNNDAGAYNLTGVREYLVQRNLKLCADGGYSHHCLETPAVSLGSAWNKKQKAARSLVETVIGMVKHWEVTNIVFRGAPEYQTLAVLLCYQLTAMRLLECPILNVFS